MSEQDQEASRVLELHLRAEELRAVADAVKDPECYTSLMQLVSYYEAMARGAEQALLRATENPGETAPSAAPDSLAAFDDTFRNGAPTEN
jgi:hypothetical protein